MNPKECANKINSICKGHTQQINNLKARRDKLNKELEKYETEKNELILSVLDEFHNSNRS